MARYVPAKGDFIVLTFDPQSGHEQKRRRPALVVSSTLFNQRTGMAMVCPVTNTDCKYPLHVSVPAECTLTGFVMVEQIKSIDFGSRKAKRIEAAPRILLEQVLALLDACLHDSAD